MGRMHAHRMKPNLMAVPQHLPPQAKRPVHPIGAGFFCQRRVCSDENDAPCPSGVGDKGAGFPYRFRLSEVADDHAYTFRKTGSDGACTMKTIRVCQEKAPRQVRSCMRAGAARSVSKLAGTGRGVLHRRYD